MEIEGSALDLSKHIVELEAQCSCLEDEKMKLNEEVMEARGKEEKMRGKCAKLKDKLAKAKEEFDSKERKWREEEEKIGEKLWQLEVEKRTLEIDLDASVVRVADGGDGVPTEVEHLKSLLEESEGRNATLLAENEALGRHNSELKMTMEAKKKKPEEEEEKILELGRKIDVLEREKREMESEFCKVKEDYNMALESEKERTNREKNEEIRRILNEKMTIETESKKKNLELVRRIEDLEREKREAEVCEAKEKSDEIRRILKEMTTLQEMHEKRILELVLSEGVLEMGKQGLEAETGKNDGVVKVLVGKEKRTKMDTNGCVVIDLENSIELDFPQQVHPESNVGPTAQNQGSQSVDASVNAPKEDSNTSLQSTGHRVLRSDIRRLKVEAAGCSLANEAGTTRRKSDGLAKREVVWNSPQKLLNAFTANDELCMRAICTLYRKQKSLGRWKYCLIPSTINKGFVQAFHTRGIALGELLTSGDPEGGLKKSLAELELADVEDCRVIAKYHYMELFQIYKDDLDSIIESSDEMN